LTLYVITANYKKFKVNNISKEKVDLITERLKYIFGQQTVVIPKEA